MLLHAWWQNQTHKWDVKLEALEEEHENLLLSLSAALKDAQDLLYMSCEMESFPALIHYAHVCGMSERENVEPHEMLWTIA